MSLPSQEVSFMLRMIVRMLAAVLTVALFVGPVEAQCGGGAGFHPFKKLRERFQERRASRGQSSAAQSSGGCGQSAAQADDFGGQFSTFNLAPQSYAAPQAFNAAPLVTGTTITINGETYPMPAARAGDTAVFDGRTWQLTGRSSAGASAGAVCGCVPGASCGMPGCPATGGTGPCVCNSGFVASSAPPTWAASQPVYRYTSGPTYGGTYSSGWQCDANGCRRVR